MALDDASLAAKLAGCAAYRTQVGFQFGGVEAMRTALVAHARTEARVVGGSDAYAERFVGRSAIGVERVAAPFVDR